MTMTALNLSFKLLFVVNTGWFLKILILQKLPVELATSRQEAKDY